MGKIVRVQAIVNSKLEIVLKISTEIQRSFVKVKKRVQSEPGVIPVSICHKDNTMTVTGEHIDCVHLMIMVRKKFGHAELLWVGNKQKEKTENNSENVQDRLLLWRLNHTQKHGSLSSQEAKQKWKLACKILAEKGLIPEDENIEENERAFKAVMESEHPNSMLYKDFAMTYSNRFSNNASRVGGESGNNKTELARLAEEMSEQSKELLSLKNAMNQLMALMQQQCQVSQACLPSTSDAEKKNAGAWEDEIAEEL